MILNFLVSGRLDFVALGLKRPFRFCLEGEAEPQNPPTLHLFARQTFTGRRAAWNEPRHTYGKVLGPTKSICATVYGKRETQNCCARSTWYLYT